jgi:hypothetical protein
MMMMLRMRMRQLTLSFNGEEAGEVREAYGPEDAEKMRRAEKDQAQHAESRAQMRNTECKDWKRRKTVAGGAMRMRGERGARSRGVYSAEQTKEMRGVNGTEQAAEVRRVKAQKRWEVAEMGEVRGM